LEKAGIPCAYRGEHRHRINRYWIDTEFGELMRRVHAPSIDWMISGAIALACAGAITYGIRFGDVDVALVGSAALLLTAGAISAAVAGTIAASLSLSFLGMASVALLIQCAHGRTEAHFAVFSFLAILLAYRDWRPIVVGALTVALHHLLFNYLQELGWGPICFIETGLMTVLEHVVYVTIEAAALIGLANYSKREFFAINEVARMVDRMIGTAGQVNLELSRSAAKTPMGIRFHDALRQIESSIRTIQTSSESMTFASNEIANGNNDLSSRTEAQAASVQETSAAIEQLAGTVRQNAMNAQQADGLATSASQVATKGGELISQVVATMGAISHSSQQISEIIAVIDGIAFQTNILALNAAVEAARAGEQGRGFAVVASEVRSLAQRSSEAAKQIKSLIESSVRNVGEGAKLVDVTGQTMADIVASVKNVSSVVGEISLASNEQSAGIEQVSQSINEIDRSTQQNAVLVVETTAAARSMKDQAQTLAQTIRIFKLAQTAT
jgi:methyl-accepting chemotaxis protein